MSDTVVEALQATLVKAGAVVGGTVQGTTGTFTDTVSSSTAVTAPTVTSTSGFKAVVGPFTYWNGSYPGGVVNAVQPLVSVSNTAGFDTWRWVATHSGSILGISVANGSGTAASLSCSVFKNGATLIPFTGVYNSATSGAATFSKGTYIFAAGDVLTAQFNFSITGNFFVQGNLTVEMTA